MDRRLPTVLMIAAAALTAAACKPKAAPQPSTPISRGQAYYTTCAGCHGNAGEGFRGMNAPRLAGLPADYLTRQLDHFRDGLRGGPTDFYGVAMNGRAKALGTDRQAVTDVAAFIATLPAAHGSASLTGADAVKGRALFESCAACHGANGEGNPEMRAPPLKGADDWYVARQLENFQSGVRGRDGDEQGQQMRAAVQALPDKQAIHDVAAYIATLK